MRAITVLLLLAHASLGHASIEPQGRKLTLEKILTTSSAYRTTELKRRGPGVYGELKQIAFDQDKALGIRWQAFMAMAKIGEKDALPEVRTALRHKDWFLRDAALRVLPLLDQKQAATAARAGLNDSALVVRSTAVQTLRHVNATEASEDLWKQVSSKDNFIRHQSLWIRREVLETLAVVAPAGDEKKFVQVLDDSDSTLFDPAIRGLERLTGQKLGASEMPAVYKRHLWQKWWESRSSKKI